MAPDRTRPTSWFGCIRRLARRGLVGCLLCLAGCGGGSWLEPAAGLLSAKDLVHTGALVGASEVLTFELALRGGGAYELVELGASEAGDEWTLWVEPGPAARATFVVALLDAGQTLQCRRRCAAGGELRHTMRHGTEQLYAGVQTQQAATFSLVAARRHGDVPAPQGQLVWLNFDGAQAVQVAAQPVTALAPFDAADVNPAYAGQSGLVMAEIARTMRRLYAAFDVTILSSADEPEPAEPHSTIYFGGYDSSYMGIGEAVDRYNADPTDQALVYTGSFAPFVTMRLTPEEMGRMIGNAAGHELGHLLGLFHTRGSQNVMDDTRSAWELAGESVVAAGPLAETVFPVGVEDAPTVLAETVGPASAQ
jgi:hypothetical protein